ncbi:hypothetical protein [Telmatospirillum sp.]|uniref:LptM family lipoprotein n=1 Tax=Telmatospirillum sp. TaxID=2079197 RepID=UPI00284047EC|nr:hypothetical protein [Telmatospirillum sp.]MDR3439075.1 hypothetical protein [Telmatospirillum sp.]
MKRLLVLCLAVFLAACGQKPIYNVDRPMPQAAQSLPLDGIERLIVEAGQTRGWKFDRIDAGHLTATQSQAKYSAIVDIYFDQKSWRIDYRSSVGLKADNGEIHDHYNFWIRNLEHDIDSRLSNAWLPAH